MIIIIINTHRRRTPAVLRKNQVAHARGFLQSCRHFSLENGHNGRPTHMNGHSTRIKTI
jgi:hypothetical protein